MRIAGNHSGAARRSTRTIGAAAMALALLTLSACAGSSDAGSDGAGDTTAPSEETVTDLLGPEDEASGEPIKVGMISDGATDAFDNTDELRAAEATAAYWNAHKGGVAGRPVEIVTCETKNDPATATDCANKFVQEDVIAVALSQSAQAESVWPPIHDAGIPFLLLAANGADLLEDDQSTYNLNNGNNTLFSVPIAVATDNDIEKLTFVVIDVPQALTSFEGDGGKALEDAGLEYDLVKIAPGTADMTAQMAEVANGDTGLVHVIGNDSFCIAAFNGLADAGYDGQVSSITQCITDATREQAPEEILDGMNVTALATVGDTDEGTQLYQAVMNEYSEITDVDAPTPMQAYVAMSALLTAMGGLEGEVTTETANAAIKAMEEAEIPGTGGMKFKCDGSASEQYASVCSGDTLSAQLDAEGNPKGYTVTPALSGSN